MPAVASSFSLEALDNTLTKNRNGHEEINPRIATHFSQKPFNITRVYVSAMGFEGEEKDIRIDCNPTHLPRIGSRLSLSWHRALPW